MFYVYNCRNYTVEKFETLTSVAKLYGLDLTQISKILNGRRKSRGEFLHVSRESFNSRQKSELTKRFFELNYDLSTEEWRESFIPNTLVSSLGRVKVISKTHPEGKIRNLYPRCYSGKHRRRKRIAVKIGKFEYSVSRIVADAFLESPDGHKYSNKDNPYRVIHLNENFGDNRSCNLKYVTLTELGKKFSYMSRSIEIALIDINTGKIKNIYRSAREAGRSTNMSYQTVMDNVNGKTKLACGEYLFKKLSECGDLAEGI